MTQAEIDAIYNRELSPEEFRRAVAEELATEAQEGTIRAHIEWHLRRYPSPLERLRHSERLRRAWLKGPRIEPK